MPRSDARDSPSDVEGEAVSANPLSGRRSSSSCAFSPAAPVKARYRASDRDESSSDLTDDSEDELVDKEGRGGRRDAGSRSTSDRGSANSEQVMRSLGKGLLNKVTLHGLHADEVRLHSALSLRSTELTTLALPHSFALFAGVREDASYRPRSTGSQLPPETRVLVDTTSDSSQSPHRLLRRPVRRPGDDRHRRRRHCCEAYGGEERAREGGPGESARDGRDMDCGAGRCCPGRLGRPRRDGYPGCTCDDRRVALCRRISASCVPSRSLGDASRRVGRLRPLDCLVLSLPRSSSAARRQPQLARERLEGEPAVHPDSRAEPASESEPASHYRSRTR